jgi:tetratricopeptide (TPR) repeat protein
MTDLPPIDASWNYEDPIASERAFSMLLEDLPRDAPAPYRAELLTQLARSVALQRRFDDADRWLDAAAAVAGGGTDRVLVRLRLERGRVRNDLGEAASALDLFREAWDLARGAGEERLAIDAAHMLGYVAPPEEAVRWNEAAIATASASESPASRAWLGTLHMNLAAKCLSLGRFEAAMQAYGKAERHRREAGRVRGARDARVGAAKALRLAGRPGEALTVVRELLSEPDVDPAWNAYADEEAGEALLALGRPDDARAHFARACPLLAADPWFPPTDAERLERIRRLGGGTPESREAGRT